MQIPSIRPVGEARFPPPSDFTPRLGQTSPLGLARRDQTSPNLAKLLQTAPDFSRPCQTAPNCSRPRHAVDGSYVSCAFYGSGILVWALFIANDNQPH